MIHLHAHSLIRWNEPFVCLAWPPRHITTPRKFHETNSYTTEPRAPLESSTSATLPTCAAYFQTFGPTAAEVVLITSARRASSLLSLQVTGAALVLSHKSCAGAKSQNRSRNVSPELGSLTRQNLSCVEYNQFGLDGVLMCATKRWWVTGFH